MDDKWEDEYHGLLGFGMCLMMNAGALLEREEFLICPIYHLKEKCL